MTASYNGSTRTAAISLVSSVLVSSLTCAPSTMGPNATSACTVTLTKAAPAGGALVALSSSNAALTVPASVTVAAAATTASFNAASGNLASNQTANVTASYNGSTGTAAITLVSSVLVSSLACSPATVGPNASTTCAVTLNKAAPAGGSLVSLSDSNTMVTVPASVTVAAAATSANFTATTGAFTTNQSDMVTAALNGGSSFRVPDDADDGNYDSPRSNRGLWLRRRYRHVGSRLFRQRIERPHSEHYLDHIRQVRRGLVVQWEHVLCGFGHRIGSPDHRQHDFERLDFRNRQPFATTARSSLSLTAAPDGNSRPLPTPVAALLELRYRQTPRAIRSGTARL